jgi:membrane protein required for colicin V production
MNNFDAVVYIGLVIAMVTGFNTGLVRSAVTILAYLVAVPIAMWAMSALSPPANGKLVSAFAQNGLVFFGVFLFAGMALGKLARVMVDEATGITPASGPPLEAPCWERRASAVAVTIVASRAARRNYPSAQWLNGSTAAMARRPGRGFNCSARPRRHCRSPDARAADIVFRYAASISTAAATYHGCSTWLQWPHRTSKII